MPVHEAAATWASIIAIVAGSNWAFGNRSTFGRELNLRSGNLWRMTRWAGLAFFVLAVALQAQNGGSRILPAFAVLGALLMVIGTARKRVQKPAPIHKLD